MKKKRIGNDIAFAWTIVDKEGHPYSLVGKDLTLTLSSALGCNSIISPFTIGGDNMNVVMWTFYGKDQKTLGKYTATLVENLGDIGMKTVDKIDAIYLVAHTYQEGGEDSCSHLTTETVELTSAIETAAKGDPGEPAGFGEVTASVDSGVGIPSVEVTTSGPDTAKNFSFSFHNLKGADGVDAAVVPGEGQKSAQQMESGAVASGDGAFAEGDGVASGAYSHAEGFGTESYEDYSHAEGYNTSADGAQSHAEGAASVASGDSAHAEGNTTVASGASSHSEGASTQASGLNSHAEGLRSAASGDNAHAEGLDTRATSNSAHAEGRLSAATEQNAHAEGYQTVASGVNAHAEGRQSTASAQNSHAEGRGTQAISNEGEHAEGKWNKSNQNTISSIGIGTSANDRKNAFEVMKDGKVFVKGVGGFDGTNPGNADDLASAIENAGSGDAVLYTQQELTSAQKNQARENIDTVGATVVSSITPAEQYVSQELMNLLAVAPTMKVTWKIGNGTPKATDKKILVSHPLMNYEGAEIVLLSYAKKNGARSKSPDKYNKGYSIATPWKDPSDYFTFASETPIGVLSTFMESFRGWDDDAGAWTMPKRTRHFGIALRIPNPAYDGPETPNKNNTYHGVPESIWSAVLRVGIYASYNGATGKDDWGIGIK